MNKLLLITAVFFFLIIFPYTKSIERFKADDITWSFLNKSVLYKEFDSKIFAFKETYQLSAELKNLDNKEIIIKGFLKHQKHRDHSDIILTENVSDVCFMCNHDEHAVFISVSGRKEKFSEYLSDDTYVKLKGIFKIKTESDHGLFHLSEAEIINLKDEEK